MLNTYPQILDLDKKSSLVELYGDNKEYIDVEGVYNKTFSFGKHAFYISYNDSLTSKYRLKEHSQIIFEIC